MIKNSVFKLVVIGFLCCVINCSAIELIDLVPSAKELKPIVISAEPQYYNRDNLWDYIDGGAPAYIAFGFEQVVTCLVMNPDSLEMVVDIYDMGDSLNAFGIYSQEKSAKGKPVSFGSNAMQYGNAIYFWQDKYYVKLIAYETSPKVSEFLLQMADILSRKIPSGGSIPALFAAFPVENKLPNSEKFTRQDVLGQQYLLNGYSAEYEFNGEKYYISLIKCVDQDDAKDKFNKYLLFKKETGGLSDTIMDIGEQDFAGTDSYYGNIFFVLKGTYIIGVLGKIETAQGKTIITGILEQL